MPTLTELIAEFAVNPAAWVRCQCCGWIAVDAVVVKHKTEIAAGFHCPYCEKDSESLLAFGDHPDTPAAPQEATT